MWGDDDRLPLPRAKSRTAQTDLPGENLCPTPLCWLWRTFCFFSFSSQDTGARFDPLSAVILPEHVPLRNMSGLS